MPEFIMVPVPSERVMEVYAILGRDSNAPPEPEPAATFPGDPGDVPRATDPGIIARAYRESSEKMKAFLDHLADRPDEWISTEDAGNAIGYHWNQVAGMLGAFGRRWDHRYKDAGRWFFANKWDHIENHQDYRMSPEAAAIIKEERKKR